MPIYLGIDTGTSACRACAIDENAHVLSETRTALPPPLQTARGVEQDPQLWWSALTETLDTLFDAIDGSEVCRILVDGTSATLLLCDADGTPLTPGLMYNDSRATHAAEKIAQHAGTDSAARGAGSSLAKLMHLATTLNSERYLARHQADWLAGRLCNNFRFSDINNALKLGYDVESHCWPDWFGALDIRQDALPEIRSPGTPIGRLDPALAARWHCSADVEIAAGTTDSTAGFVATGAHRLATGVTALGSTLVIKVLAYRPVFSARHGVYSHALGGRWLAGGASNAGGAVLRSLFSDAQITALTKRLQPDRPTGLDYYPLLRPGERFPVQDPDLPPRLTPRPDSDAEFFQGILEGLAAIEERGYRLLESLGAPYPEQVISVGGGAANAGWERLRENRLGVPVSRAPQHEAAYGAALLALRGEAVFPDP